MRIAALYDIHGNLPALEAVLGEVERAAVDVLVIGGDIFPGPMSAEVLDRLLALSRPVRFLRGNGDRWVCSVARGGSLTGIPEPHHAPLRWLGGRLRPEHRQILDSWPTTIRLEVEGLGSVLFCHATPRNDMDIFTRETPDDALRPIFDGVDADLVVCGHTHMQFDRTIDEIRVVNAGSIGMPFGDPGAYWLLLDGGVALRHTVYDLEAAAARIRATDFPNAEAFAADQVENPPSEQTMLDRFRAAALGAPGR